MDSKRLDRLIQTIMDVFNKKQTLEEYVLKQTKFNDITVKELHTIVSIGLDKRSRISDIARELGVTIGTLSVSIRRLVAKNYVQRERDKNDRRVVYLSLTKRGRVIYRLNQRFYLNMVKAMAANRSDGEVETIVETIEQIHDYIEETSKRLSMN